MLRKMYDALERKMICAAQKFKKSERGDTNFISILIILGIVIVVAGVFITFKDDIVTEVEEIVNGFSIRGGDSGAATP